MRLWPIVLMAVLASTMEAKALVIDAFDAGPLVLGPEVSELGLMQAGLPASSVIGGQREWFALYGGSLGVNESADGVFRLNHDRGVFEVALVRYGELISGANMAPLNANFSAGGHNQITLRIEQALPGDPLESRLPLAVVINVRSGVGGPNAVGASSALRPRVSDDGFVLQFPYESFVGSQGAVDFSDIDGIGVSFFVEEHVSFVVDEIVTSAGLPGDYNLDGVVNAGDYSVWRDQLGSDVALPNENPAAGTPKIVDAEDFDFWKSRFGEEFPAASGSAGRLTVVPEPGTQLLFYLATAFAAVLCRGKCPSNMLDRALV